MWRELLHGGDPGLEDDFFDAGGDSLLALRLLARERQQHGVDLTVAALFQDPTLAAVAARVEALLYLREGERRADDDQGREVLWF
jgi:aryl carrier-like protein